MNKTIGLVLKIGFLIAASVAGAGFASGKEIMCFFTLHGEYSTVGIIVSAITMFAFSYIVLNISYKEKIYTGKILLRKYFGSMWKYFENTMIMFMFVVFSTMVCGAGELIYKRTGISYYLGTLLFLVIVIWFAKKNIKVLQKISFFLMAILFCGILFFSFYISVYNPKIDSIKIFFEIEESLKNNISSQILLFVIWEALLYSGYNMLLAFNTLVSISEMITSKKIILLGSFAGIFILITPAFLMNYVMIPYIGEIMEIDFPFVYIIGFINSHFSHFYEALVFCAIFLCAVMNGYYLRKINKYFPWFSYGFIFTGFSGIISKVYPFFGIVGIIFIFILFKRNFVIYFRESKHFKHIKRS